MNPSYTAQSASSPSCRPLPAETIHLERPYGCITLPNSRCISVYLFPLCMYVWFGQIQSPSLGMLDASGKMIAFVAYSKHNGSVSEKKMCGFCCAWIRLCPRMFQSWGICLSTDFAELTSSSARCHHSCAQAKHHDVCVLIWTAQN